jgi:UDP-N-acetylglucosamine--N-acetylmuramyl-(pentapeptide) pyrophosphoryl-undecaprenol N-acetylglucosamine transferase
MKVIISGGGTGGHVFPAIATADCLKQVDPDIEILFVGAMGKMEMERVPQAGYSIVGLWISGFQRRISLKNLSFPFKLLASLFKAARIIRKFKPDAVAGFGGYASGPVLEIASRKGIPSIIQEQNSYAGITNRILAKRVDKICVAYPGMEKYFPADKIIMTGNPVRNDLLDLGSKRDEAIQELALDPEKKTVLLFGGSLGARTINEAVVKHEALLSERDDIQVLWQIGKLYAAEFMMKGVAKMPHVHPMTFITRMDLAYAAADVVACRAGALTISELTLAGKASILVPSPNVAEDHQRKNAQTLVDRNAALMIEDAVAGAELIPGVLALLDNSVMREKLEKEISRMARPNAGELIAGEIYSLLENP